MATIATTKRTVTNMATARATAVMITTMTISTNHNDDDSASNGNAGLYYECNRAEKNIRELDPDFFHSQAVRSI